MRKDKKSEDTLLSASDNVDKFDLFNPGLMIEWNSAGLRYRAQGGMVKDCDSVNKAQAFLIATIEACHVEKVRTKEGRVSTSVWAGTRHTHQNALNAIYTLRWQAHLDGVPDVGKAYEIYTLDDKHIHLSELTYLFNT